MYRASMDDATKAGMDVPRTWRAATMIAAMVLQARRRGTVLKDGIQLVAECFDDEPLVRWFMRHKPSPVARPTLATPPEPPRRGSAWQLLRRG